jgi:hypothetical protein
MKTEGKQSELSGAIIVFIFFVKEKTNTGT